jgi:hypothetical protein
MKTGEDNLGYNISIILDSALVVHESECGYEL